ncbi:hypothetical protein AAC387_Pa10g0490 [Persea americana]
MRAGGYLLGVGVLLGVVAFAVAVGDSCFPLCHVFSSSSSSSFGAWERTSYCRRVFFLVVRLGVGRERRERDTSYGWFRLSSTYLRRDSERTMCLADHTRD